MSSRVVDTRFDDVLGAVARAHSSLPALLQTFFSFLQRNTDFFIVDDDSKRRMGFGSGDAEDMLLKVFHSFAFRSPTGEVISHQEIQERTKSARSASKPAASTPARAPTVSKQTSTTPPTKPAHGNTSVPQSASPHALASPPHPHTPIKQFPALSSSVPATVIRYTKKKHPGVEDDDEGNDESDTAISTALLPSEMVQIPIGNGGVGKDNSYWWTQTLFETTIYMPLPADIAAKAVQVQAKGNYIKIVAGKDVMLEGELGGTVKGDAIWSLDSSPLTSQNRVIDVRQPPFHASDVTNDTIMEQATRAGLFAPCKLLVLCLEKASEVWWRSIIHGHPQIEPTAVDSTLKVSEYDPETQAAIRKVMYDQSRKAAGLPTSEEEMLQDAAKIAGSPYSAAAANKP